MNHLNGPPQVGTFGGKSAHMSNLVNLRGYINFGGAIGGAAILAGSGALLIAG
jgi:hypothetical protein